MVGVLCSTIADILYVTFYHATVIGVLLAAVHVTRTKASNCGARGENRVPAVLYMSAEITFLKTMTAMDTMWRRGDRDGLVAGKLMVTRRSGSTTSIRVWTWRVRGGHGGHGRRSRQGSKR